MIPAGARVLGAAAPVQAWGDSRLAVSFHRLVMPDGHTYSLDLLQGTGSDRRDRPQGRGQSPLPAGLWRVAGHRRAVRVWRSTTAAASTRARSAIATGRPPARSLASSSARVLDRYLNVLPTITIREGYRIKVYLTNDLNLPAYEPAVAGGVR